jgi:hypothetical protein
MINITFDLENTPYLIAKTHGTKQEWIKFLVDAIRVPWCGFYCLLERLNERYFFTFKRAKKFHDYVCKIRREKKINMTSVLLSNLSEFLWVFF